MALFRHAGTLEWLAAAVAVIITLAPLLPYAI